MENKKTYRNRRKTFHFSQKNDDLLQYLNSKDTKDQSAFIMRLIRDAMEREKNPDPLHELQQQLNQALAEINRLQEKLANPTPISVGSINTSEGGIDEETINRLFIMLADIKHSNEQQFSQMKNLLSKGVNIDVVEIEPEQKELTDEEFDALFDDTDLDF